MKKLKPHTGHNMAHSKEKGFPKRKHGAGSRSQQRRVVWEGIVAQGSMTSQLHGQKEDMHATVITSSQVDGRMSPNKAQSTT
jgi:hypothetical protein